MSKIMRVFYDNAGLPYKDSALSIHYPILEGGEFIGANNTTDIYFYTTNLGDFYFVANCKLPNGALVDKLLTAGMDEFGTYYALSLDSELTEFKGHLKVALKGYGGDVNIETETTEDDTTIVVINGNPTIAATGIVDIAINYAPLVHHISTLSSDEYTALLAVIGQKLNIVNGIYVIANSSEADLTNEGQLYYVKANKLLYRVVSGALVIEKQLCVLETSGQTTGSLTSDQLLIASEPNSFFVVDNDIYLKQSNTVYVNSYIYKETVDTDKTSLKRKRIVISGSVWSLQEISILTLYSSAQVDNKFVAQTNNANKVYATDNSGNQTTISVDSFYEGNIVRRDTDNSITVPLTPTQNGHASSKQYTDTKVSKVATANILYGRDDSNEVVYSIGNYNGDIPIRNANDTIYVPTPDADTDAANKKYVNDQIATALTSAIVYKDSLTVAELNALDKSTLKTGWLYNVEDNGTLTYNGNSLEVYAGDNVIWVDGAGWDKSTMDLSVYNERFIAAGFFDVSQYNENTGELDIVYASDLYILNYDDDSGVLTIAAN